jgi:ubiquinone/menaquinone biosynthesis C-methylase UbiE
MAAPTSLPDIRAANVRYHDLAADGYDAKWGIDYGELGRSQVAGKLRKALGVRRLGHFGDGLEIGAGTGYFGLNLLHSGTVRRLTATDISRGMLRVLARSARRQGLHARTECCEAAALPFEDDSFDLVFGHAVLHHLPDLEASFGEFLRVLRPGGAIAFCGEPSRYGDRIAELPKRAAHALAPAWRALLRTPSAERNGHHRADEERDLERVVDVHAFTPASLTQGALAAGFTDVQVQGEELVASLFGWANRVLESTAEPARIPWLWRQYAYHGYLTLQALDRALLEPRLPAALFYNLLLSARAPAAP